MAATMVLKRKKSEADPAKVSKFLAKVKSGEIVLFKEKKAQAVATLKKAALI